MDLIKQTIHMETIQRVIWLWLLGNAENKDTQETAET